MRTAGAGARRPPARRLLSALDSTPDALEVLVHLIDGLPSPVVLTDDSPELRCLYGNAAWQGLIGRGLPREGVALGCALEGEGREAVVEALTRLAAGADQVRLRELSEICGEPGPWSCDAFRLEGDHHGRLLAVFSAAARSALRRRHQRRPDPGALSAREREVAELVARGMNNAEIAQRLNVRRTTVASHVSEVLARLGFTSRVQIAVWMAESRAMDEERV